MPRKHEHRRTLPSNCDVSMVLRLWNSIWGSGWGGAFLSE